MAFITVFCLSLLAAFHASAQSFSPTAAPIPSVSPTVQAFIDDLETAILYAELISNGPDAAPLCSDINPSSLDGINGIAINGTIVKKQVCGLAEIESTNSTLAAIVVGANQLIVQFLAQALFAVQVAGGYAGGTDLAKLCSEIETSLINNVFMGFISDEGTAIQNFVCSAASASASATPACTATPSTTPAPYHNTTTTTTSACSSPTGFANTVVPAPTALARSNFQVAPAFAAAHQVVEFRSVDITVPEAFIATECLNRCVAYRPNSTTGPCLSFNVNLGRPIPPTGNGGPLQYFCSGFDAYLANDGSDFVPVDVEGSYMFGLDVNRVCSGTYRAY